jgi:hypothetical protein
METLDPITPTWRIIWQEGNKAFAGTLIEVSGIVFILFILPFIHVGEAPYKAKSSHTQQYKSQGTYHGQVDGKHNSYGNEEHANDPQAFVITLFFWLVHGLEDMFKV